MLFHMSLPSQGLFMIGQHVTMDSGRWASNIIISANSPPPNLLKVLLKKVQPCSFSLSAGDTQYIHPLIIKIKLFGYITACLALYIIISPNAAHPFSFPDTFQKSSTFLFLSKKNHYTDLLELPKFSWNNQNLGTSCLYHHLGKVFFKMVVSLIRRGVTFN